MQALHLDQYTSSLDEIKPVTIPRPSISAYLTHGPHQGDQILLHIAISHSAINHVDLLYAHGVHQNNKSALVQPPFTLGLEFAGIVLDVYTPSSQSCPFQPGDQVWGAGLGSHAEEIIVSAAAVRHLPPGWSLCSAAGLGAATIPVSYGALTMMADLQPGETVLVHAAAGGLGVYAVQLARALGCRVIATVGSEAKMKKVEELLHTGCKEQLGEGVVRYDQSGWQESVQRICKEGVDVVFDTVGLVTESIKCTAFNGRIVVVGFAGRTGTGGKRVQDLEKVAVNRLLLKQIKLLGYRYGETGRRMPEKNKDLWRGLMQLLAKGHVQPVVYKVYKGLDQAGQAMRDLSQRRVIGKAVVEVQSEEKIRLRLAQIRCSVTARL